MRLLIMMDRNLRRSVACLVAFTLLAWVITLPLCFYSYANHTVMILWYVASILLLVAGLTFVTYLRQPKNMTCCMSSLQLAALICITVAGICIYGFMHGELWFYAINKGSDGCSVQDISVLAERGKATLRCNDGYIPPPEEGVTLFKAEQTLKFKGKSSPGTEDQNRPFDMYVLIAPLYSSIATSTGLPVALAVSYGYKSFADTIQPSSKPTCGSEAASGFCGYTLNFIDVELAHWQGDMQAAVASALGTDSPWKDLPIVAPSDVSSDMSRHGWGFWLGLFFIVLGSPICVPLCCLFAVRSDGDDDFSSMEEEDSSEDCC